MKLNKILRKVCAAAVAGIMALSEIPMNGFAVFAEESIVAETVDTYSSSGSIPITISGTTGSDVFVWCNGNQLETGSTVSVGDVINISVTDREFVNCQIIINGTVLPLTQDSSMERYGRYTVKATDTELNIAKISSQWSDEELSNYIHITTDDYSELWYWNEYDVRCKLWSNTYLNKQLKFIALVPASSYVNGYSFKINDKEYKPTALNESSLYGTSYYDGIVSWYGSSDCYVTEFINASDFDSEVNVSYSKSDEIVQIPVTFPGDGLWGGTVHDFYWEESEWVNSGSYVSVGDYIYISVGFDEYSNHKLLINGEEVALNEEDSGLFWYCDYEVKNTDEAVNVELIESAWSNDKFNKYVDIINENDMTIFSMPVDNFDNYYWGWFESLPNTCGFAVIVDNYDADKSVFVNGKEYNVVPFAESTVYQNMNYGDNFINNYLSSFPDSDLYVTEPIYVSDCSDGIEITYKNPDATPIPVSINSDAVFAYTSDGNLSDGSSAYVGDTITLWLYDSEYMDKKVTVNGTEITMSRYYSNLTVCGTYTVKDTDTEIIIELVDCEWGTEELKNYSRITSDVMVLAIDENDWDFEQTKYIYNGASFAAFVPNSDYSDDFVLLINGKEYELTPFLESSTYNSIIHVDNFIDMIGTETYVTEVIPVSDFDGTIEITYEEKESLAITSQPSNYTGKVGETATFTVTATGATSYQWQQNTGAGWANINTTAGRKASFSIGITAARANYQYRCVVSDGTTSVISNAVKMIVKEDLAIKTQPSNYTGKVGETATFTVAATGATSYQWQQNTGAGWANINTTAGRKASFSIGITAARAKYQYRCIVSDGTNTVTSTAVKMIVKEDLAIKTQPTNYTGKVGETATFTVVATGATSYQWQQNTGAGWANINTTAGRKSSFSIGITAARANYQYRCVVSDGTTSLTSNAVKMIIKEDLAIKTQPSNYTGKVGETATFTVAATGATSYQWQQNTGAGWANINTTAGRKASFSIGITAARAKYQYRCIVSDGTTSLTSTAVKMIVKEDLAIKTQPSNYTGKVGATATFTVAATGDNLTYQWQQNTGAGWANINTTAGRKASFSIGITAARANYQYRCVVSDGTTSLTSNAVKMIVKEDLAIKTQPSNYTGKVGETATFTVAATGATSYQWQQNTGAGWANINTTAGRKASFSIGITAARAKYQYRCIVSDGTNTVTSTAVKMVIEEVVTGPITVTITDEDGYKMSEWSARLNGTRLTTGDTVEAGDVIYFSVIDREFVNNKLTVNGADITLTRTNSMHQEGSYTVKETDKELNIVKVASQWSDEELSNYIHVTTDGQVYISYWNEYDSWGLLWSDTYASKQSKFVVLIPASQYAQGSSIKINNTAYKLTMLNNSGLYGTSYYDDIVLWYGTDYYVTEMINASDFEYEANVAYNY